MSPGFGIETHLNTPLTAANRQGPHSSANPEGPLLSHPTRNHVARTEKLVVGKSNRPASSKEEVDVAHGPKALPLLRQVLLRECRWRVRIIPQFISDETQYLAVPEDAL